MPRRQIMRQTSMRCIDSAVSPRLCPWPNGTPGIRSVVKPATKLGEIAGVVSVNMTDESVLAD